MRPRSPLGKIGIYGDRQHESPPSRTESFEFFEPEARVERVQIAFAEQDDVTSGLEKASKRLFVAE